jgi:predicted Zn-dependent peptidase
MGLVGPKTVQLDEHAWMTEVDGGPLVLSETISMVRSVAAGIWVRWGASHDLEQQMGASHLLEHMIFKGTERRTAREIALGIEAIGGSLDAYTSREHTACHARVLDEHLPVALDVLSDLVFRPILRESDLEIERRVILEEIAGVEDTPDDLIFDLHSKALWGDHPYGYPVLGTSDTVKAISRDDLGDLWSRAYRPDVSVVCAAGHLEHDELLELVAREYPQNSAAGVAPNLQRPTAERPREIKVSRDSAQVHVCVGTPTFPRSDPRRYASILISTALGGGMSSRLFQRVREELGLAYTVYTFQSFYAEGGLGGIYMATRPDTADRAVGEVMRELERMSASALSGDELADIKNQTKGQVLLSLESTSARLHRLAGVAVYGEPYMTLDEICAKIDAVTEEEVAGLCREYYAPDLQTIVRLGPNGE